MGFDTIENNLVVVLVLVVFVVIVFVDFVIVVVNPTNLNLEFG